MQSEGASPERTTQSKMPVLDLGPEPIPDIKGAIFERMIIIVPYKSPDTVKHIEA